MKRANIATLRSLLAKLLNDVQGGEEVEIQRRNVTIAKIVPVRGPKMNQTKLGIGRNTVKILGDITEPAIPASHWEFLR